MERKQERLSYKTATVSLRFKTISALNIKKPACHLHITYNEISAKWRSWWYSCHANIFCDMLV